MSYLNEIAVALRKSDYKEMLEGANETAKKGLAKFTAGEFETPDETYVCLYAEDFDSYGTVEIATTTYIRSYLNEHRHAFVRLGETPDDVEYETKTDDEFGCDEEFKCFIEPVRTISGLKEFGLKNDRNVVYGCTIVDSAIRFENQTAGGMQYRESKTKLFGNGRMRFEWAYEQYEAFFGGYGFENGQDEDGYEKMTREAFLANTSRRSTVIQGPDSHVTFEFFEQEVE